MSSWTYTSTLETIECTLKIMWESKISKISSMNWISINLDESMIIMWSVLITVLLLLIELHVLIFLLSTTSSKNTNIVSSTNRKCLFLPAIDSSCMFLKLLRYFTINLDTLLLRPGWYFSIDFIVRRCGSTKTPE